MKSSAKRGMGKDCPSVFPLLKKKKHWELTFSILNEDS
jgi:hypothetical protein